METFNDLSYYPHLYPSIKTRSAPERTAEITGMQYIGISMRS